MKLETPDWPKPDFRVDPCAQQRAIDFDRVVSLKEASFLAGVSLATLRRAVGRGDIQILRLSPRRIGVRLSALDAMLSKQK